MNSIKKAVLSICIIFSLIAGNNPTNAQTWWAQTSNTTVDLHDINFSDSYAGYVFGDTLSTMVKTNNSGDLWSGLSPTFIDGELLSSAFLGSNSVVVTVGVHDVVGGKGLVMKTANGGTSWAIDTSIAEKLFDVSFANSTDGWISGENGYIARTTNGGTSWTQLTTGTGEDIFSIHFTDANEGWGVGTVDSIAVILHSTNAGTNWTMQTSGVTEPLFSVFFVNAVNGWAVGDNGTIIATTDGGTNWASQTSGTLNGLFDVHFLDALKGWAVGGGGTVLKTTDGGVTWIAETSGTGADIHSIIMRNENLGWFCGDGGIIRIYGTSPSAINEVNDWGENIDIYPNPTSGRLNIDVGSTDKDLSFALYNIIGKLVVEKNQMEESQHFVTGNVPPGMYLLKITDRIGQTYTEKIIFE